MASALELFLMANLTGGNTPVGCDTDPTSYTPGNVTAATALSKTWTFLPGTPVAGTVYQLDTELTATLEGNAMAFAVALNNGSGVNWTQMNPALSASAYTSGTVIGGWLSLRIRVLSPTTARFALCGALSETTVSVSPTVGSTALAPLSQTLTVAAGTAVTLGVLFGASTSGQGAASYGSSWLTLGAQA
jgi:hypothetical protein